MRHPHPLLLQRATREGFERSGGNCLREVTLGVMKIATWNVNSIRSRIPRIADFCRAQEPDVLCMQETKVSDDLFPVEELHALGYEVIFAGERSYNGVAIASRLPMTLLTCGFDDGGPADAARLIAVEVEPAPDASLPIINTYVPQGRTAQHEQFVYKLEWLARLRSFFDAHWSPRARVLWVGDINVAPEPIDVYAPERRLNDPDFHPDARAAFAETAAWGFVDCFRQHHPDEVAYSFFDYREVKSVERNHGWRVDHIMATKPLAKLCTGCWIDMAPRLAEKPSDHTPVVAEFAV